ncbi:biotin-independent malonate decarboxylase subunit gamma [Burkholderia glumae]|uniref:Biotin-independent malonate decarboxylase subunit gamma n=3 Tax=Burkholderia glumae TaxID=337 RepID=A0AAP9Y529_BURGL|nr:biotin-independent malonate decarboxylase subunit gamma [Burkholderia glumae]ACR28288.1 Malonate decarboxylase subunit gamma [Burkholderia glumae BGR1]AJY65836.1 malonate decarboxylase gamma subunit family protein [Burkholderia glumae LMG 2196 = ATCC 33617]KHJ61835.1 malonate decarboxylase subunit gamma [Burkholderia glumae]MCM2480720.1 biotin-independent malonate decarboxylase subunit gamma [Burkholderia glumae]MCM2492594.1 biotin-independent malonate decarboxylase subunit gamma [Burkholde
MTLDDILASFDHDVSRRDDGLLAGRATLDGRRVDLIGVSGRAFVGVDEALWLSARVLETVRRGGGTPILVLLDSGSQRMSKRDELLGLNECLSHLAKTLMLASGRGHATVGLLYGGTAAGAFIATALATRVLLALPGAEPAVMDLPSMARVTKLPLEVLEEKAKSTAVFAPGLANLEQTGAVDAVLDPGQALAAQLARWLAEPAARADGRDRLGEARGGRPAAARIAQRVHALARAAG